MLLNLHFSLFLEVVLVIIVARDIEAVADAAAKVALAYKGDNRCAAFVHVIRTRVVQIGQKSYAQCGFVLH